MIDKRIIDQLLKDLQKGRRELNDQVTNNLIDLLKQKRSLRRDLIILSATIAGFIIPLLINSGIDINQNILSVALLLFVVHIGYGAISLIFYIQKDSIGLQKVNEDYTKKINKVINLILSEERNPESDIHELHDKIQNILKDDSETKNNFDHDPYLLSIFIVALFLFAASFLF